MAFVWNCPICTFQNVAANVMCVMCQQGQRPQALYFDPNQPNLSAHFGGAALHPQRPPIPEHKENYPVDSDRQRPRIRRGLSIDDLTSDSPNPTQSSSNDLTYRQRLQQHNQQAIQQSIQQSQQSAQSIRRAYTQVFDRLSLSEQQRMLQYFLQQQDKSMAIELQEYMVRKLGRGRSAMGRRRRKDAQSDSDDDDHKIEDEDESQLSDEERWKRSHEYVRKFRGKTLTQFCLRKLFVDNTFHSMARNSAITRYLSHFNDTKIYYSAIEITLRNKYNEEETYLIYPDWVQFVNKHFLNNGFAAFSAEISTEIGCSDMDWSETMYRGNYGVIQSVTMTNADDIELVIANQGFLKKHIFSDEAFLRKSILPMEILEILCYEYSGIEQDVVRFNINHPSKRTGEAFDYNWICHKVKDARKRKQKKKSDSDCMQYVFAGKILGKYVNVTTAVRAGQRYPRRVAIESDTITTRIQIFPPEWKSRRSSRVACV